ncbi:hypothetical protein EK21DRAFT_95684 [Setomelanomma holmii]|uniref:Uncharacterized protein n=1 Tax=Setomelanomma holmii TaxID=210430 RepID=A0A9P4LFC7_9PLEO|nr:hypothetical protein EK21DRAFT_95684 [Setomelanomma holmii]
MQFKLPLGLISYSHLGSSATVNSKASDDSSGVSDNEDCSDSNSSDDCSDAISSDDCSDAISSDDCSDAAISDTIVCARGVNISTNEDLSNASILDDLCDCDLDSFDTSDSHINTCRRDCLPHDSIPFALDTKYLSFSQEIEYAKRHNKQKGFDHDKQRLQQLAHYFSLELYESLEETELKMPSKWRGDYLHDLQTDDRKRFKATVRKRYFGWLTIHDRALSALEGHFRLQELCQDKEDIRTSLLRLWAFLPQDFCPSGEPLHLQERHVKRLLDGTQRSERNQIQDFLSTLVSHFCNVDKGALLERIRLVEQHPDAEPPVRVADLLATGAYSRLMQRQLLQTPLMFWPAMFKPGVSQYFETEMRPPLVYYDDPDTNTVIAFQKHMSWESITFG